VTIKQEKTIYGLSSLFPFLRVIGRRSLGYHLVRYFRGANHVINDWTDPPSGRPHDTLYSERWGTDGRRVIKARDDDDVSTGTACRKTTFRQQEFSFFLDPVHSFAAVCE
jgi:hypothetical protein